MPRVRRQWFATSAGITTRYVVHAPSAARTPAIYHYAAEDLDEVKAILAEQGTNARRCSVSDRGLGEFVPIEELQPSQ